MGGITLNPKRMDGQMDGWMGRWVDRRMSLSFCSCTESRFTSLQKRVGVRVRVRVWIEAKVGVGLSVSIRVRGIRLVLVVGLGYLTALKSRCSEPFPPFVLPGAAARLPVRVSILKLLLEGRLGVAVAGLGLQG